MMKKNHCLLVVMLALSLGASAQSGLSPSVLASAGASHQGSKIQLNWTLGEVAVATVSTDSGFLTEGFQQPEMLRTASVTAPLFSTSVSGIITIAPNPVRTLLTIRIPEAGSKETSTLLLYDTYGRQIQVLTIAPGPATTELDFSAYPAGTYWLHLHTKDVRQRQTFKVIHLP